MFTSLEQHTDGTTPRSDDATIAAAEKRSLIDVMMWSRRGMATVFLSSPPLKMMMDCCDAVDDLLFVAFLE